MKTWLLVLLTVEVLTLVGTGVALTLLRRRNLELQALRDRLVPPAEPPATKVRQAAGWAVKTAIDLPGRVRERGLVGGLLMAPIEEFTEWVLEERAEIDAVAAPDGTVTIMFSDIEESTALNERLGDKSWVRLLAAHDKVVREQVRKHRGHVVKSQGDGFMMVFGHPWDAVDAALRIQRAVRKAGRRLRRTPVRVRIGIHIGTVVARGGDYFGRNVAKAARVAALAGGGQVLASDELRAALENADATVAVEPAGEHELKGLAGTHVLWAVRS